MLKRLCWMHPHTAGIVFGWLGSIGSFVGIIGLSIALQNVDKIADILQNNFTDINISKKQGYKFAVIICSVALVYTVLYLVSSVLLIVATAKNIHLVLVPWLVDSSGATVKRVASGPGHRSRVVAYGIALAMHSLHFVSSILIMMANNKKRHLFLLPWLILVGISLAVLFITSTMISCELVLAGRFTPNVIFLMACGLCFALNVYIYYGIFSLYKYLRARRDQDKHSMVFTEEK